MPSGNHISQADTRAAIVRQRDPLNFEFSLDPEASFLTSNPAFYFRNHFPAPSLNAADYRLQVRGAVERRCAFSFDDLRAVPAEVLEATLECAGNGRHFLVPPAEGVQWQMGAIGTARWKGVPLRRILEAAGVLPGACEVVCSKAPTTARSRLLLSLRALFRMRAVFLSPKLLHPKHSLHTR